MRASEPSLNTMSAGSNGAVQQHNGGGSVSPPLLFSPVEAPPAVAVKSRVAHRQIDHYDGGGPIYSYI